MKKQFLFLLMLVGLGFAGNAQHEYRLSKSKGTLKVGLNNVIIEGYDGKEIIFSGAKTEVEEVDERAKGLTPISASGFTDNTGLGISVSETPEEIVVKSSGKKPIGTITIKVPQGLKISMMENSNRIFFSNNNKGEIFLKNLKNEIEISVYSNKIKLENNTGPMNIKTVSGPIEAIFSGEIKGPISLISVTDYVDITLPSTTKANIELSTNNGKIYAAREFKIDFDKQENTSDKYVFGGISRPVLAKPIIDGPVYLKDGKIVGTGSISASGKDNSEALVINSIKSNVDSTKLTRTKTPRNAKSNDVLVIATNGKSSDNTNIAGLGITGAVTRTQTTSDYSFTYSSDGVYFGSGEKIKGKINGGGIDLIFKSSNKNVYLRQK